VLDRKQIYLLLAFSSITQRDVFYKKKKYIPSTTRVDQYENRITTFMLMLIPGSRISSVSLVTKLGAGNRGTVMRFPTGVTNCSVLRNAQTGCATHRAPNSVGAGEERLFLRG